MRNDSEWSECSQETKDLDELEVTSCQKHIQDRAHDDEEVQLIPRLSQIRPFVHDEANGDQFYTHLKNETEIEEKVNVGWDPHDQRIFLFF